MDGGRLLSVFLGDAVLGSWQHLGLVCSRYLVEPGTSLQHFLAVITADSTFLFALLWCGNVVVCSMPHVFVKDLNLVDVN